MEQPWTIADYYKRIHDQGQAFPKNELAEVQVDLRRDDLEQVVWLANYLGGPQIKKFPNKGYGIVAERDYDVDEVVTYFGGELREDGSSNDYVVSLTWYDGRKLELDPTYMFKLGEKGRFVNDSQSRENCSLEKGAEDEPVNAFLVTEVPVQKGKEFLWDYGEDYNRSWRKRTKMGQLLCQHCLVKMGTHMCGYCDTMLYCSQECADQHWTQEHFKFH